MIGRWRTVVFDTRDPRGLGEFYAELLGGTVAVEEPDGVVVTDPDGRRLACQPAPEHAPPRFPDPAGSQQVHLDVLVDDVDDAERRVPGAGCRPSGPPG